MKKLKAIEEIKRAIEYARFTNASFGTEAYTNEIKEATKLYRESWIIGSLERALELLNKTDKRVKL